MSTEACTAPRSPLRGTHASLGVRVVELRERREDLEASLDADAIVLLTGTDRRRGGKLREALENGDRPDCRRLLQSAVAEIRAYRVGAEGREPPASAV